MRYRLLGRTGQTIKSLGLPRDELVVATKGSRHQLHEHINSQWRWSWDSL
jgi:hypothetical protein